VTARVVALHLSTGRRAPLQTPPRVTALAGRGLDGDRHAKPNTRRSVLLVEMETLEALGLAPGDVREQVTTSGLGLDALAAGTRLRIGDAVLEIGQPCAPCSRMDELRPGLRAALEGRRGRFARVVETGTFAIGDPIVTESPAP
jgi:MOSC domain-containing protein YiiM